jgi:hypothetical protein
MIGFHGSFRHGDRYNIVLEFADKGSLERYFKITEPPAKGEDIIGFWESLFMVIAATRALHSGDQSSDGMRPLQGCVSQCQP